MKITVNLRGVDRPWLVGMSNGTHRLLSQVQNAGWEVVSGRTQTGFYIVFRHENNITLIISFIPDIDWKMWTIEADGTTSEPKNPPTDELLALCIGLCAEALLTKEKTQNQKEATNEKDV